MRAAIQRKPLGFQELTLPKYRCVSICVTDVIGHEKTFSLKPLASLLLNQRQPNIAVD